MSTQTFFSAASARRAVLLGSLSAFLVAGAVFGASDLRAPVPSATPDAASALGTVPALDTPFRDYLAAADLDDLFPLASREQQEQYRSELEAFYAARDERPVWTVSGQPRRELRTMLDVLDGAWRHGLEPEMYRATALRELFDTVLDRPVLLPAHIVQLDVELNAASLHYLHHLLEGRIDPDATEAEWHVPRPAVDLDETYRRLLGQDDIAASFAALEPTTPIYDGLQSMYERYQRIVEAGGWQPVPDGPGLAKGERVDPARYEALVERLRITGDLTGSDLRRLERSYTPRQPGPLASEPDKTLAGQEAVRKAETASNESAPKVNRSKSPKYTGALVRAVRSFQERHGLDVDGKVGPNTLAALNVPAEERLLQIAANLDRWRWMSRRLPADRIQVNIADQMLEGYRDGEVDLEMRVVVGKPTWSTPVFADEMVYIEVNPYWNVPRSIAGDEIIPKTRRNPNYIRSQGMEVFSRSTGKQLNPSSIDWASVSANDVRVRQRPGKKNALGTMKFIFPNNFNVYLHDTPARRAFERNKRALSHGCVRVHEPMALADWVLEPQADEVSPLEFREKLASAKNQRIDLETKLPVFILYWTAFRGDDGRANFRSDIYDRDEDLIEELEEQTEAIEEVVAAAEDDDTAQRAASAALTSAP